MNNVDVIVSLTTYKGRIYNKKFLHVLYSLVRQKTQYSYKVVLVLSEEEFPKKEAELPEDLLLFTQLDNFEILWTYKNTKALKKYNPTNRKYKNTPIICIGDDTIYSEKLVQTVFTDYLKYSKNDKKVCLCASTSIAKDFLIPYRIRIFSPKCMFNLSEEYFTHYFHENDDLFYSVRLKLNKTEVICIKDWEKLVPEPCYGQEQRLCQIYGAFDQAQTIEKFFADHNELMQFL